MLVDKVSNNFLEVFEYAQSLEYYERPDYQYIKFLLRKICLDKNIVPGMRFIWKDRIKDLLEKSDEHESEKKDDKLNFKSLEGQENEENCQITLKNLAPQSNKDKMKSAKNIIIN